MLPTATPQLQTSATSSAKASTGDVMPSLGGTGGAGNRGFVNNVAFPGSKLNADQQINPPVADSLFGGLNPWLLYGAVAVLGLILWKKYGAR